MKILVLNGPNLNRLGARSEEQYGLLSLEEIESYLFKTFPECEFTFFQSNYEGAIIDEIQNAQGKYDGLIINPGAYAHTSLAIMDALFDVNLPKVEVHLSHIAKREDYRKTLLTAQACDGYISGFREDSYLAAAFLLVQKFK